MSRELRSITRVAENLADPRTRPTRKERRTAANEIARDAGHLLTVVGDLLLLSRLGGGELSLRRGQVRVPELVRSAVTGWTAEAEAAGVALTCRVGRGPSVAGDMDLLRRALDGLVRDAVKFSEKGGTVAISARSCGTQWTIQVTCRPNGNLGDGLGLVVCQRLVELYDGDLTVESTVDTGTTMCVTIPVPGRAL
jgi:signal transduction histidine kinase